MPNLMGRRDLFRMGLATAAIASIPFGMRLARGGRNGRPTKNVLLVFAQGGWDTTYALDPKPGLKDVDAPAGEVKTFGKTPILVDPSRPSVTQFFESFGSMTAVIRGIQVRSFIHNDCTKRVLSGTPSDTAADFGAIVASELGKDLPVPYLVLGASAMSGPLAPITGRAGTTNQLAALISPAAAYPAPGSPTPTAGFVPSAREEEIARAFISKSAKRLRALHGGRDAGRIDELTQALERSDRLRNFALGKPSFAIREYAPDLAVQVKLAVAALESGLSHSIMMEMGNFDTHNANAQQSSLHERFFASLFSLAKDLEAKKLLDKTLVVVLSEMGRTPKLNSAGGKDHWPVTSAMVFGQGVRAGAYGESDERLGARSIDLATGSASAGGKQLQTGNFVAGLLASCGVDPSAHLNGVEAFDAYARA